MTTMMPNMKMKPMTQTNTKPKTMPNSRSSSTITSISNSMNMLKVNPDWTKLPLFDRKGWQRVRFGDVVENANETCDPTDAGITRFIAMEHLEPGSLHVRSWGDVAEGTTFTRRCRPGQVLFGKRRAYQRKVAVADFDAVVSGDIYVLTAKDPARLLPELLPFLCLSERFFQHAVGTSAGSLSPRTNWTSLASFEFDLPPLDQQRRLAEILSAMDEANEAQLAQLPKLKAYQRAVWEAHKAESGVRTMRIGDVAVVANGSTPSKAEDRYWIGGTFPWLPTGKVHDRFIRAGDEFITEAALKERKARVFPRGSVLVAMIGQGKTRGSAALMEIEASVNQNFACITPHEVESHYLFYALDFSYDALRRSSHGSNQEALNCGLVSNFPIPLATRTRQQEISAAMQKCEDAQNAIQQHCANSSKLLTEFINSVAPA